MSYRTAVEGERGDEEREAVSLVLPGHEVQAQHLDKRAERGDDDALVHVGERVLEQRAHRVEAVAPHRTHDDRQRATELLAQTPRYTRTLELTKC